MIPRFIANAINATKGVISLGNYNRPSATNHMKIMTLNMPKNRIALIDKLVECGLAPTRSELMRRAINVAICALIKEEILVNELIGVTNDITIADTHDQTCVIEIDGQEWIIPNQLNEEAD